MRRAWLLGGLAVVALMACVGDSVEVVDGPSGASSSGESGPSSSGSSGEPDGASSSGESGPSSSGEPGGASSSGEPGPSSSGEPGPSSSGGAPATLLMFLSEATQGDFAKAPQDSPWDAGDRLCRNAAEGAGLSGSYVAFLSYKNGATSFTGSGRLNNVAERPIYRPEAAAAPPTLIASNLAALFASGPVAAPKHKADGEEPTHTSANFIQVWTGSTSNGTVAPESCDNWSSNEVGDTGRTGNAFLKQGDTNFLATDWISYGGGGRVCQTERAHLYCIGPL